MKINIVILIALFSISLCSNAQQAPNGGFEIWAQPFTPDGWTTYSSATLLPYTSEDTEDYFEGTRSAQIKTTHLSFAPPSFDILSLGTVNFSWANGFSPNPIFFPFRPDTLFFAYKYTSPATDTALASIKLSDGNNTLIETVLPLFASLEWAPRYILLTPLYQNATIPDSLLIQFKSSVANGTFHGIGGSILHVDDVHFGYVNTSSTKDLAYAKSGNLFPNPANSFINCDCDNGFQLFSSTGILIKQSSTAASVISVEELSDGIYLLKSNSSVKRFVKLK